jgi:hypothetical protein
MRHKRKRFIKGVTWRQYAKARCAFYIKLASTYKAGVIVPLDDLKRWHRCMTT